MHYNYDLSKLNEDTPQYNARQENGSLHKEPNKVSKNEISLEVSTQARN